MVVSRLFVPVVTVFVLTASFALTANAESASESGKGAWKFVKTTKDGIEISRRAGRTSGYYEYKFVAESPVGPEQLEQFVWKSFQTAEKPVKKRTFLVNKSDEVVFHDLISVPVVSNREYTMRIVRKKDQESRRFEFRTAPELGPPQTPDYVTMAIVFGCWEIRPGEDGGSKVTYTVYSEPGGSVTPLIVRGPQLKEATSDFRRTLKDAKKAVK